MIAEKIKCPNEGENIDEFPEMDLDCAVDESGAPTQLTVFDPGSEYVATSGISVDYDTGVSLQQIR
ncbi:hypothetical protein BRC61_01385 [Halobacteriales archaeon QH_10_65_19]|nr:MAG: hypothetical protein BRC61_01385 [Halobacteriales archaeon QH_10_65_19]